MLCLYCYCCSSVIILWSQYARFNSRVHHGWLLRIHIKCIISRINLHSDTKICICQQLFGWCSGSSVPWSNIGEGRGGQRGGDFYGLLSQLHYSSSKPITLADMYVGTPVSPAAFPPTPHFSCQATHEPAIHRPVDVEQQQHFSLQIPMSSWILPRHYTLAAIRYLFYAW